MSHLCQELCLVIVLDTKQHQHSNVSHQALGGGWNIVFRLLDLLGFMYSSRTVLRIRSSVYQAKVLGRAFFFIFQGSSNHVVDFSLAIFFFFFYFPQVFFKILNSINLWFFFVKINFVFAFSAVFTCCMLHRDTSKVGLTWDIFTCSHLQTMGSIQCLLPIVSEFLYGDFMTCSSVSFFFLGDEWKQIF